MTHFCSDFEANGVTMGALIDGEWDSGAEFRVEVDGSFEREQSGVRNWVADRKWVEFPAVAGRYRLYVSPGCPWAHRTTITRAFLGLEDSIEVCWTLPIPTAADGWVFAESGPHACPDGRAAVHELYRDGAKDYTGRATVPLLWDKESRRIVNNESSEIIRMFARNFSRLSNGNCLVPPHLIDEIDELNARIYEGLNNGVYRAGFARDQSVHDAAVAEVFQTLDWLEFRLATNGPYLFGDRLTEADVRLVPTLVRFEAYREAFYCDVQEPSAHPNVWNYRERMLEISAIADTTLSPEAYVRAYASIPFAAVNNAAITKRPRATTAHALC